MAEEDIIVRLKAEARTDEMKRFASELDRMRANLVRQGASEATAQSAIQRHYRLTTEAAQRLGRTLQQHLQITQQLTAAHQKQAQAAQAAARAQQQQTQQAVTSSRALVGVIGNVAARYLSVAAAADAARRAFVRWGDVDQQFRRLQNQAGSSRAEVDALRGTFDNLARTSGQGLDEIIKGFDTLREKADLTLSQTKELFPTIVQGAEAAGTSATEMATAFASLMNNMKVTAPQAGVIMNQMATAAKDLGLNINEMVGAMPQLTEVFGSWGYTGARGHAHMLAWVSALKNVTGGTGAAANAMSRMLEQMSGPTMARALGRPQRMLQRMMEDARDSGKDVMSVAAEMLIHRAQTTGRTTDQLLAGFSVRERRYWRVIINNLEETRRKAQLVWEGSDVAAVRAALNMRTGPGAEIKRLSAAWDQLLLSFGKTLDKIGVTSALQEVAEEVERIGEAFELFSKGEFLKGIEKLGIGLGTDASKRMYQERSQRKYMRPGSGGFNQSFEDVFRQREGGSDADRQRLQEFRDQLRRSQQGPSVTTPQRFMGGTGAGDPNNLLGLPDPTENFIEDRRGENQQIDATQRLVYVMERIALLLEDFLGVQGGAAGGAAGGGRVGFMSGGGGGGGGLGAGAGRIGAGGGGVGGGRGGGVGGGGAGGVAGRGGGGGGVSDPMGGGAPGWQLDTPGTGGEGGTASGGKGSDIYNKFKSAYEKSGLVGTIPPGGEKFGFKTGSADEWARFGTAVANAESGFNPRASNPSDPGGSHGILQYAHGQVPGGNANNIDKSIDAFVRDSKTSVESGKGLGAGSLLGRRFSTIGKHPERTARKLGKDIGTLSGGGGGGDESGTGAPGAIYDPITSNKFMGGVGANSASRGSGGHQGEDWGAAIGTPVHAVKDGVVERISTDNFGTPVAIIRHPDGTYTRDMHLQPGSVPKVGTRVSAGQPYARSGTANGVPHLHHERWVGNPGRRGSKLLSPAGEAGRDTKKGMVGGRPNQTGVAAPTNNNVPTAAAPGYDRFLGGKTRGGGLGDTGSNKGGDTPDTPKNTIDLPEVKVTPDEAPPKPESRLHNRGRLDAGRVNMAGDLQEARSSRGDRIARSVFRRASEGAGADIGVA